MLIFRRSGCTAVVSLFSVALLAQFVSATPPTSTVADDATASVGIPASDVGVPASDVGTPASDVGIPASNVGTPVTQALPPSYTDDQMIYHVSGKNTNVTTDIVITSPKAGDKWITNATNTLTWTGTTPTRFSFQLINDDTSILASGISLRASVSTSDGSATCDVPKVKPDDGYYVRLYDQLDISKFIAQSDKFSIVNQSTSTDNGMTTSSGGMTPTATTSDGSAGTLNGLTGTATNISTLSGGIKNAASSDGIHSHLQGVMVLLVSIIAGTSLV